jgi:glycosyltransferase involved in cell wall biosynthesis
VILEAAACGTPVYATPVAGVPDVVREGETGFLMEELDSERIVEDVVDILALDQLPEISANCRQLIEEEYSFDASVERYRQILQELS